MTRITNWNHWFNTKSAGKLASKLKKKSDNIFEKYQPWEIPTLWCPSQVPFISGNYIFAFVFLTPCRTIWLKVWIKCVPVQEFCDFFTRKFYLRLDFIWHFYNVWPSKIWNNISFTLASLLKSYFSIVLTILTIFWYFDIYG